MKCMWTSRGGTVWVTNIVAFFLILRRNDLCWYREQCLYFVAGVFNLGSFSSLKSLQNFMGTWQYRTVVQPTGFSHTDQGFCPATRQVCSFGKVMVSRFWTFELICDSNQNCYSILFLFCPWCFLFSQFLHPETLSAGSFLWLAYSFLVAETQEVFGNMLTRWRGSWGNQAAKIMGSLWLLLLGFSPRVVISCDGSSEWKEPSRPMFEWARSGDHPTSVVCWTKSLLHEKQPLDQKPVLFTSPLAILSLCPL